MKPIRILAIALLLGGVLALAYGKFSFPGESHHATVGNMNFSFTGNETVNVPLWAGVGAVVAGALLLFVPMKRQTGN